jgi:transcriptional regulator with XRE-family HTH domain
MNPYPPLPTIRARREALGLSQEQLARIMGVSRSALNGWETGRSTPHYPAMIGLVLDYLEVQRGKTPFRSEA